MQDVEGKVAFVTGGGSGIGLGIVSAFVEAGMQVMIADLRQDYIDDALAQFEPERRAGKVAALRLDVTDRVAFAKAADETWRLFGKAHVLVSNAGVGIVGPVEDATYEDWDFGLGVNLGGAINGLRTFLPRLIAQGEGGHIVTTSSQAGITPAPRNASIYATAKAALVGMSEAIRDELADHDIGVSVLLAGFFRTNIREVDRYRPNRQVLPDTRRATDAQASPLWREPIEAGRAVLDGIKRNALYIATHGELRGWAEGRFEEILAAYPPPRDAELAKAMGRKRPVKPF